MHAALGIGVVLFGSWVLNTPVPEPEEQQAPAAAQQPAFLTPRRRPSPVTTGTRQAPAQRPTTRAPTREEIQRAMEAQRLQRATMAGPIQPGMSRVMPSAPTEVTPPGTPGMLELPLAPTFGAPAGSTDTQDRSGASRVPLPPTYRAAAAKPSTYTSYAALEQQRQMAGMAAFRSFTPVQAPEKVYSGTQVYTPGVSAYMNLFRNDTNLGTIDNYTTLVRPQLLQQQLNQRVGNDLFGLQRDARLQQASLQQVQTNYRTLQSVGTPQYFMGAGGGGSDYNMGSYSSPGYGVSRGVPGGYYSPSYSNPGNGP